jgi:hypothetical protein
MQRSLRVARALAILQNIPSDDSGGSEDDSTTESDADKVLENLDDSYVSSSSASSISDDGYEPGSVRGLGRGDGSNEIASPSIFCRAKTDAGRSRGRGRIGAGHLRGGGGVKAGRSRGRMIQRSQVLLFFKLLQN